MESEFWGLVLVPNKKFSNESTEPVRLTMACFGEKVVKNSRSCVVLKTQEREFVICVLSESKNESQTLDVMLPSDGEYSFSVTGPNEVHLTGQILDAEEDSFIDNDDDDEDSLSALYRNGSGEYIDDDEDDEDDEDFEYNSDSDELEPANIEEVDDDDDDDDDEEEEEEVVQAKTEKKKENAKKAQEKKSEGPETNGDKPLSKAQRRKLAKQAREETLQSAQGEKRKADEVEAVAPKANKKEKVEKKSAPAKEAKKEKAESKTAPSKEAKKENNDKPKITTLQGGLIVEDRVSGTGPAANKGSTVCVRYLGRLMNGKVFDSNQSGKPFSFKLGKGDVIKGWDLGIAGMKVGGQRKLTIPPALAYGARGAPPDIPKNAKLEFEVKLLEVKK